MKSDLYAYNYGTEENMVELTFKATYNSELSEYDYYKVSEDEILEIAEKIKKRRKII